jgi:voltage-gated potassium channel
MAGKRQLVISILILIITFSLGTIGYTLIEGWSFFDSLYMTVITLATIGYQEVHPLTRLGRVFTIVLVLFGVGVLGYALRSVISTIIEGEIREVLGRRQLEKRISQLKNHYIICGFGRMGRIVCRELSSQKKHFVVLEKEPEKVAKADKDIIVVNADATEDESLIGVGIKNAKGLIAVLSSDAENLYVVMSARVLNPKLTIIARALTDGAEQKLIRAGATRVISPYHIGGMRIAYAVLKPNVDDFIEFATSSKNLDLQLEEIVVQPGSKLSGLTLAESKVRSDMGIMIVAIKRASGNMVFNPSFKSIIEDGDTLIALGEARHLKGLEKIVQAS